MERILSIDFGMKRFGIAVSDPLGITAQPLPTYVRTSRKSDIEHIKKIILDRSVGKIVFGLPLNLNSSESEMSLACRDFALEVGMALGVKIDFFDERMSTAVAERMLQDEADLSREKRKKIKDKLSAIIILRDYLRFRAENRNE